MGHSEVRTEESVAGRWGAVHQPASPASGGMAARPATGRRLHRLLLLGAAGLALALALGAPRPAEGKKPSAASKRYGDLFKQRAATTADREEKRADAAYLIPEEDQVSQVNFAEYDLREKTEEELHVESRAVEERKLSLQNEDALFSAEARNPVHEGKLQHNLKALTYHEMEWMEDKVLYENPSTQEWSTDSTAGGACVNMTDPVSGRRFTCVTEAQRERLNHPSLFEFPGVGVSRVKTEGYTRKNPGELVTHNITHESLTRQTHCSQILQYYMRAWTAERDPETGEIIKGKLLRDTHRRGRPPVDYSPGRSIPVDSRNKLWTAYSVFTPACVEYGVIGMVPGEIREIECPWYHGVGAKGVRWGPKVELEPYQDLIIQITMYKLSNLLVGWMELQQAEAKTVRTQGTNLQEDF